jgi:hypothetical protein
VLGTIDVRQQDLLTYWVVKAYNPDIQVFYEYYKSYGRDQAQKKLIDCLGRGICAIIERRDMTMI